MKHIEIRYLRAQGLVAEKLVQIVKVDSSRNLADIGTKYLPRKVHEYMFEKLGMINSDGDVNSDEYSTCSSTE